ncbi:MAG: YbaK/EbsC family protein [Bdellovibrionota bacterium]|nr:MAG: YbaK/EbsC family protein [Bdellovibrionota bacterium]
MHQNCVRVQQALQEAGLPSQVVELPASTRTAAEAAAAVGTTVAQIAKSIVFVSGAQVILAIVSGANRVSAAKLMRFVGPELRQPRGEEVKTLTNYPIGGIPPLGHAVPVRLFFDQDLLRFPEVWAAAGTPHAVFRCSPQALVKAVTAEVCDLREES